MALFSYSNRNNNCGCYFWHAFQTAVCRQLLKAQDQNTFADMNTSTIPFSSFANVSVVVHFFFAVPAIGSILFLRLMDVTALLCVFFPIIIVSIFTGAAFKWLIAKGSNWANTPLAIKTLCALPSIYVGLSGGVIGLHFFGIPGSLLFAIVFMVIALVVAVPLGKHFNNKLYSETTL